MRILIYLGTIAILLMAFEVKASWQTFEEVQIDISPWLYEERTSFSEWSEYITLGTSTSRTIRIEEKTLSFSNDAVAIAQRITNLSSVPYCFLVEIQDSLNTMNTHLREGRTIVYPNETALIGGYRINEVNKNWKSNWSFQASKKLESCR